jgi:hypothetical protein
MQSPNGILTVEKAAGYFPSVDASITESPVFQDMIDDAMAVVIEALGFDISAGEGVAISQTFQPDVGLNWMLRTILPMDPNEPVTITEGPDSRVMNPVEFTRYTNMILSGGAWANYYWFDRGSIWGSNFMTPITITYTPRDTVFRVIKQFMLDLLRLDLMKRGMDSNSYGLGAVSSITDQDQTVSFSTGQNSGGSTSYEDMQQHLTDKFLVRLRGPRVG